MGEGNRENIICVASQWFPDLLMCLCIPHSNGLVIRASNNISTIKGEPDRSNPLCLPGGQIANLHLGLDLPDSNCVVASSRYYVLVRGETD